MKKNLTLILIIIVVVLILMALLGDSKNVENDENVETLPATTTQEPMEVTQNETRYQTYSEEKLSFADEGKVVLNFSATWCPSCRALEKGINENLDDIPEDLKILKVDYDSNTELRKKYGVKTQHTLVQVDSNGDAIKMWSGGTTLDSIISKVE